MGQLDGIISHKVYDSGGNLISDQPQPMQFEGGLTVETVGGKTIISASDITPEGAMLKSEDETEWDAEGIPINMHDAPLTDLEDPSDPQDAATKIYVDSTTVANSIATDKLLGRDTAGTGEVEAIGVGGGIEFTGSGAIQRSALTGDVTADAGSGSTTIAPGAVSYSKLQDISAASRLLGRGSAGGSGDPEEISCGSNISLVGTVLTPSLSPAGLVAPTYAAEQDDGNSGASKTINFATGLVRKLTLTDNAAITYEFPGVGWYQIKYFQDGTGSRIPTYAVSGGVVYKAAGFALSTGASAKDIVTIYFDGTDAWETVLPSFAV